jgi:hypothetical protein
MANSFVNNSGLVAQALADRSAVNSYQDLMNNINSTIGNLVNTGVNTYQNNKIANALKNRQQTYNPQAISGFDTSNISNIGSGLSSPMLFNQASDNGVSPQAESVNNGLNYQAGIEQALKFGRWDVANKLAQTQQNEEETAFRKEKMAQAQAQQDIENDFRERQLNQQREIAEQKLSQQQNLTPTDLYRMEQLKYNQELMNNLKYDRFERTTSGKEMAKARNEATQYQNVAKSLKDRINEIDFDNLTDTKIGRILDKIGSQWGISTQGSKKLDDLRMVNSQIMNEMRQTLRGQGAISDQEAKALPNIFMFTSDGRIKNNAENFIKYLDSVEQRKIDTYNDLYKQNLPRIENQGLMEYYEPMKSKNNNQYAPKEFTLKRDKNTGQVYKVFSDGSYELFNE